MPPNSYVPSPLMFENRPLVGEQTSSSPTHISARQFRSFHLSTKSQTKSREQLSVGLKNTSILGEPPSYQREITATVDKQYQLVNRMENLSYHQKMDLETQRMKEKDTNLKRKIRRFRFVVRSLHLACRCVLNCRYR